MSAVSWADRAELTRRSLLQGAGAFGLGGLLAALTPQMAGAEIDTTNRPVIVVDLAELDTARDLGVQLAELAPTARSSDRALLALFGRGGTYSLADTVSLAGRYSAFITLDEARYVMTEEFRGIQTFVGGTFQSRRPLGHVKNAIRVTMIYDEPTYLTTEAAFVSAGSADDPNSGPSLIEGCSIDGYSFGADLFSNSTIRDCTVSNISGGAFVRARGENILIENNRSRPDAPLLYPGTIGAHIIVSRDGENHTIRNNHFIAEAVPWQPEVINGATGDMIAIKGTKNFLVENNTLENSGEYGIVVSHGARDGAIVGNTVIGTDGCAIVIGVDDVLTASGASTRARVENIDVHDNHILDCGLDRGGDLGRSRATPNNSVLWNYPNSLAGIRVTNADTVTIKRNSVNQYRSSAIWVTSAAPDEAARALSQVTNLKLDATNSLHPFAGPVFDDKTWQELDADDRAPWSGTSKLVDETGEVRDEAVFGIDASRIVGFADPKQNPIQTVLDTEEVYVTVTCLGGNGRIDVQLLNKSTRNAATYSVTVGPIGPRRKELTPLQAGRVTVTGRPNGPIRVTVLRDDEEIYEDVHTVECS